ncbi:MAG: hypothetical protein ACLU9S_01920 [Oscillospiraceae bacterium]
MRGTVARGHSGAGAGRVCARRGYPALYEGDGSLLLEEKQTRDFSFTLSSDTAGNAYALEITYWAVKDKNVTPQVSMTLKGTSTVF